jgi:hypothetical protein
MVVVHDSIRRQFGAAPALVRGVAVGDAARTAVVADHVHLLGELLHHHHTGEDRLLWPVLQPRVPADVVTTVERMEAQHEGIAQTQATVTAALSAWRAGAGEADREALATALDELHERITEHLGAEEQHILPLAAEHMTAAEWQRLGEEGIGGLPKSKLPLGVRDGDVPRRPRGDPGDAVARPAGAAAADALPRTARLRPVRPPPPRHDHPVSDRAWQTSGSVERVVPADPAEVYAVVSDVTRIGERSPECHTAAWLPGARAGTVGAVFRGSNRSGWAARWSRRCQVIAAVPGRAFAFRTLPERLDVSRRNSTTWRYDLEPAADGATRVVHSYEITALPVQPLRALFGLLLPHHRDMRPLMQPNLDRLQEQFARPSP